MVSCVKVVVWPPPQPPRCSDFLTIYTTSPHFFLSLWHSHLKWQAKSYVLVSIDPANTDTFCIVHGIVLFIWWIKYSLSLLGFSLSSSAPLSVFCLVQVADSGFMRAFWQKYLPGGSGNKSGKSIESQICRKTVIKPKLWAEIGQSVPYSCRVGWRFSDMGMSPFTWKE